MHHKPYHKPPRGPRPRASTATPPGSYCPASLETVESFARYPRLLVRLRDNSAGRREFLRFLATHEVASERSTESGFPMPVQEGTPYYVLYGAQEALTPLQNTATRPYWCISTENVSSAAPPRIAAGACSKDCLIGKRGPLPSPKPGPLATDKERRGVQGLN